MSSDKEEAEKGEWEEVVMMMELPSGANLNAAKKDLYLQVAGMWTEKPVVKLDNMLYAGSISEVIGSHLFVESKEEDNEQREHKNKDGERQVWTAEMSMKLDPVYLLNKTDESSSKGQGDSPSMDDIIET